MVFRLQRRFQFTIMALELKVKVTFLKPVYGFNCKLLLCFDRGCSVGLMLPMVCILQQKFRISATQLESKVKVKYA